MTSSEQTFVCSHKRFRVMSVSFRLGYLGFRMTGDKRRVHLRHQCASAPRTSGTCRLFLITALSLGKKDNVLLMHDVIIITNHSE